MTEHQHEFPKKRALIPEEIEEIAQSLENRVVSGRIVFYDEFGSADDAESDWLFIVRLQRLRRATTTKGGIKHGIQNSLQH